ncbi:DUF4230 domain-containing protein [Anaeromyxobacter oryzae]|uniref:DUF4230 domain-containing protein n=1 Tax=Anaeromyxobacter oryzae TaxID=2918170 RepID=A0ABN6MS62_9BACT|nr:DUF4230 domain-containing protein [Anaeromyxobacter oryzae]BDG03799.1 hypothetical protein AMOR_27950 [Anaeromyxobacter oryzae]
MRRLVLLVAFGLAVGGGLGLALRLLPARAAPVPDPPAVVMRIREVARLEALDVALYKKVSFAPDPAPAGSLWGDVAGWLRHTFATPRGKAIVFADAHVALELERLDARSVSVVGRTVTIRRPPLRTTVALRPGETEIIGSNLDSADTARLLELARRAFEQEVERDAALQQRARASAERAIRALLYTVGFTDVVFVDEGATATAG